MPAHTFYDASEIEFTARLEAAYLVERGTMPGQKVTRLAEAPEAVAPYFATVLVHGHGRRPKRSGT